MRYAVLIGFKHDGPPVVIHGPEVPIAEQKNAMRAFKGLAHHDDFERVELLTSDSGMLSRKRLAPTPVKKTETTGGEGGEQTSEEGEEQSEVPPEPETEEKAEKKAAPKRTRGRAS